MRARGSLDACRWGRIARVLHPCPGNLLQVWVTFLYLEGYEGSEGAVSDGNVAGTFDQRPGSDPACPVRAREDGRHLVVELPRMGKGCSGPPRRLRNNATAGHHGLANPPGVAPKVVPASQGSLARGHRARCEGATQRTQGIRAVLNVATVSEAFSKFALLLVGIQ